MSSAPRRIAVQGPLGFSSGLPRLLTAGTLTIWLTESGAGYVVIGAFGLISLIYNAKILWAPVMDRYGLGFLDRRRGWILLTQILLAVAIAVMGMMEPTGSSLGIGLCAVAVAFLSSSQDIVVDAYRTDLLPDNERGKGTALYVSGYRIAMIFSGSIALVLADVVGWRATYWMMAGLMLVNVAGTLWAPALPDSKPPPSLRDALFDPLKEFFSRDAAIAAIAFVMLYKFGESVAGHWVGPFLRGELDFSKTEIGTLQKALGFGATIVGAAIGGIYADRWGVKRALLVFGIAQAVANIGYVALAVVGKDYPTLILAIGIDNICNGMGVAAFVAFLMALCHREYSATQYALLASASSILGHLFSAGSGFLIEPLGWPLFFGITIFVAAPALLLWRWLPDTARNSPTATDEAGDA